MSRPFSYVDGTPVLREVSIKLAAGTVLGLVGSTGGGKSTITRLLTRMIELQEGSVYLGGVSVRELSSGCDPTLWHEREALVTRREAAMAVGLLHAEEVVAVNGRDDAGGAT